MLPLPWKRLAVPDSNREYLALLSFLLLKHYRMIPKFLWLTLETLTDLSSPGLEAMCRKRMLRTLGDLG